MTPSSARPNPPSRSSLLLVALGLAAVVVAFLAGRWQADQSGPELLSGPGRRPAGASARATPDRPRPASRPEAEWLPQAAGQVPEPVAEPVAAPAKATREVVARAAAETSAVLEASRQELGARCWPRQGLASGKESTLVTFNVTYDASGREVARGLGEDRRARAPEVLTCLQKLPLGSLRISPPGTSVGVRVAMRLP